MNYAISTFSEENWAIFRNTSPFVDAFNDNPQIRGQAALIQPGDITLCYLLEKCRWVGILEAQSRFYVDEASNRIRDDGEYPLRFDVKPLVLLDAELGIQMDSLMGKLSFYPYAGYRWQGIVRRSLTVLTNEEDAKTIIDAIVERCERNSLPMDFSLGESYPCEMYDTQNSLHDGAKKTVVVNAYERNPVLRKRCIDHYKAKCAVCEMNFEDFYGVWGKDYIHVHHLTPLAEIGREHEVHPINDLRPVCPNCHAMLHRDPKKVLSIDELKRKITNRRFTE